MNILVTGGAGYIGSHCLLSLLDHGYTTIYCIDNLSTGQKSLLPEGVKFFRGDLSDHEFLEIFFEQHEIDTVMHFAASISAPESVQKPEKYYLNNTVNTAHLLEICARHKIKNFIFSSTAAVYGNVDQDFVTLKTPTSPVNPYGWSKLFSERMILDICNANNMKAVILRYFNVAGADAQSRAGQVNPNSRNLFKVLVDVITGDRENLNVYGTDYPTKDGTCVRDYIDVADLAEIHVQAIDYLKRGGDSGIFNCGYGAGYTVKEVMDIAIKEYDIADKIIYAPRRQGDPMRVVLGKDPHRFWNTSPSSIEEMLEKAVKWKIKIKAKT